MLEVDGYRFDMGPTILLMPSVLKRIFAEAGRELADELDLIPLDPQWRSFFDDGSTLDLHADRRADDPRARRHSRSAPKSAGGYGRFLDLSERLDDISHRYFFWRSVGGLRDMFDPSTAVEPLDARRRPADAALEHGRRDRSARYVADRRVAQMLDHFTQYVGSAPDLSPAVLCGIAHMQTGEGVWYPRGGTRAVAEALIRLAASSWASSCRTGADVREIALDEDGRRRRES